MANPNGAAVKEKPDDLEISSIGSLYSGPWDKKYWSSSRGKDRYPYPIGYGAVRAHNGSTYKMEIQEGPKGPLFSIIAADGQSCSGQTPDIAWEKFQKKCFPRTKIWHGKRFSCKIDGVEFFGFKNPFVQRLLRELATDVNGAAEQSLLPSSSCNGASRTDVDNRSPEAYSDLGRPQITGKRSRKRESGNAKSSSRTGINKTTTEDLVSISEASSPIKGSKRHCNNGNPMPSSLNEEHDIPAVLPPLVHLVPVHQEESEISAKDHLPLDSVGFFNHLSKDNIPEDSNGPGKCKATPAAINMSVDERKPVDRSQGTKMEDISFPMAPNDQNVDATIPQDCQGLTDVELFAPDTLDFTQDKTADSSSTIQLFAPDTLDSEGKNADSSSTIQDRSTMDVVIADGLLTESHPEEETPTVKSNASSQNIDFDSVGQEMAKSMMAFLLPQAIPLLNKGSKKKKGSGIPSEVLPFTVKSQKESNEITAPSPGLMPSNKDAKGKKMHTQSTDIDPIAPTKSIIPDSLDDDQNGDHVSNHLISLSDKAEPDQHNSDGAFPMNSHGHLVSSNEHGHNLAGNEHGHLLAANEYNKLIDDQQETSGSNDAYPSEEVGMASTGRLQECGQYILESLPVCATPYRKVFSEEITEKFHIDECPVGITLSSKKMNETAVDPTKDIVDDNRRGMLNSLNISEKETAAKTLSTKTENLSFSQVPKLVYTRKKVQTISHMKGNNSGPVSKSIICKNNVPETYPSTETLQVGSSDDNSNIRDSFCAEAKIVGRSSLNAEKPSMNSKAVLNSMGPAVLQDLIVGEKDTSYFCDLFVSHLENQVDKNVVGHENLLQFKDSETSHKQGPSFSCDPNSIPFSSDLKPHNMELNNGLVGILEFVGCYTHPVPVLSVLLSTKGNHIYICVLCGLLVGKDISLFIYKVDIEELKVGHPSLVGHTSVTLPDLTDYFGGMALGRSCLQLTPDGQCLVLLDSIKTPFCRQGKTHCLCTTCASSCSEENAVKIVQVKLGYVSLVARLKAVESQRCILVCEPSNLVSVGKTGRLHLWVMDSTWSAQMEYMVMPSEDCISPGIVELKRIPNCTHLIVGHNGYGEFSLWDIFKRILVSRFLVPSASICQFFPISLFAWQMNFPVSSHFDMEEHVNQMMASTSKKQFLSEGEDVAVCLLVSSSDFDAQQDYESGDCHPNPVGRWRLALMVKNMVIFGTALDSRASVIGASAGQGICGTCDGLVYMWELSSGTKLGTMHHFKGGGVSCISTDDSRSGAVAIAGDNQVLVYLRSRKYSVN